MARFKENDLPKSKLPLVLLKAKIILNMQVTIVGNSMLVWFFNNSVTALAFLNLWHACGLC
jgi:hypothetical protein